MSKLLHQHLWKDSSSFTVWLLPSCQVLLRPICVGLFFTLYFAYWSMYLALCRESRLVQLYRKSQHVENCSHCMFFFSELFQLYQILFFFHTNLDSVYACLPKDTGTLIRFEINLQINEGKIYVLIRSKLMVPPQKSFNPCAQCVSLFKFSLIPFTTLCHFHRDSIHVLLTMYLTNYFTWSDYK